MSTLFSCQHLLLMLCFLCCISLIYLHSPIGCHNFETLLRFALSSSVLRLKHAMSHKKILFTIRIGSNHLWSSWVKSFKVKLFKVSLFPAALANPCTIWKHPVSALTLTSPRTSSGSFLHSLTLTDRSLFFNELACRTSL